MMKSFTEILLDVIFESMSAEEQEFIDKVKKSNPEKLTRYRTLVANRGLDAAKHDYKKIDPEELKKGKVQQTLQKRKEYRKKYYQNNKEKIKTAVKKYRSTDYNDDTDFVDSSEKFLTKLANDFVSFLPSNFPDLLNKFSEKANLPIDQAYYTLLGKYEADFINEHERNIPLPGEFEYFDDKLETMIYGKYGNDIEF